MTIGTDASIKPVLLPSRLRTLDASDGRRASDKLWSAQRLPREVA